MEACVEIDSSELSLQLPEELEGMISRVLMPREVENPNFILRTGDDRDILLDVRKGLLIGDLDGIPKTSRLKLRQLSAHLVSTREQLSEKNYFAVSPCSSAQASVELAHGC